MNMMTVVALGTLLFSGHVTYSMQAGNQLMQGHNSELINIIRSNDMTLVKVKSIITKDNNAVHDQDEQGNTALALVIPKNDYNNYKIIGFLLHAGADINKANNEGVTPLMVAMRFGSNRIIQYLIAEKAKINAEDCNGNTTLLRMISNNQSHMSKIKVLLKNNADIDKANYKGLTPLMAAVSHNNGTTLVRILITLGANALAKDNEGKTALMHAEEKNAQAIIIKRLRKAEREQKLMVKDIKK